MKFQCPIITVEEHWLSQSVRDFYTSRGVQDPNDESSIVGMFTSALMDLEDKRIQSMDAGGVSLQVVSHVANSLSLDPEVCFKVNDEIAERIKQRPGRFAAFATLPMANPKAAGQELRRCVRELGFVGALIDSNCEGKFYDDQYFWPVFEAAEELDVPIYLHPTYNEQVKPYLYNGSYPQGVADALSQFAWGWHSETAIHFLRLFAAGLFDHHPKLKLMLGHLGEMLPFQLNRIEGIVTRGFPLLGVKLERKLRQVWDENVWITIAGVFFMAPMAATLRQCKLDRIIYSVDYPFENPERGLKFLEALKSENGITEEVLEGIAYKNAERLLKIRAPRST